MEIKIVKEAIDREQLAEMAEKGFGDVIKLVVDIEQGIMAAGGEFHADEEVELMEREGSKREHTWGVNLSPKISREEWIQFDSVINIKPFYNNRSRKIENPEIQKKIKSIINNLVVE